MGNLAVLLLALQCDSCTSDSTQVVNIINPVIVSIDRLAELQRQVALPSVIRVDTVATLDSAALEAAMTVYRERLAQELAEAEGDAFWPFFRTWAPIAFSTVALIVAISYAQKGGKRGLRGPEGIRGPAGPEGPRGPDGPPGKDGKNGKDGHTWCWPPGHCKHHP